MADINQPAVRVPHIYNHQNPDLTNLRIHHDHCYLNGDLQPCVTYHMINMADEQALRIRIQEQKPEVDLNYVKVVQYDPFRCKAMQREDTADWYARQKKEKEVTSV